MSQSLSSIHLHAIFSTKNRQPFLEDKAFREDLHRYMGDVSRKIGCEPLEIGGVADHVHLLVRFGRTISVAEWIKEVKRVSNGFVREKHQKDFLWQGGYGVFAVENNRLRQVTDYVRGQEEHHKEFSFQDEYRSILKEHGVQWDENYLWD